MDGLRRSFEQELKELAQEVEKMGNVVLEMLKNTLNAFSKGDKEAIRKVIDMDDVVDRYNLEIETRCLELIATQQPMARDLRFIASTMRIISDVERMGDYTVDVAKFLGRLVGTKLAGTTLIPKMFGLVMQMLKETLEAMAKKNLELITQMIRDDDQVDLALKEMFDQSLQEIEEDPKVAREAIYLLLVARYLERIADHITNVGERVYYSETGLLKELH